MEKPYVPFYKPYGMSDEEYEHEVKIAEQRLANWEYENKQNNMKNIKYEDLACELCNGQGEREINVDGADCPCICSLCNGTGVDIDTLKILVTQVKHLLDT